jgi:hypothetical protein
VKRDDDSTEAGKPTGLYLPLPVEEVLALQDGTDVACILPYRVHDSLVQTLMTATKAFIAFALQQDDESKVVRIRPCARHETTRGKAEVGVR